MKNFSHPSHSPSTLLFFKRNNQFLKCTIFLFTFLSFYSFIGHFAQALYFPHLDCIPAFTATEVIFPELWLWSQHYLTSQFLTLALKPSFLIFSAFLHMLHNKKLCYLFIYFYCCMPSVCSQHFSLATGSPLTWIFQKSLTFSKPKIWTLYKWVLPHNIFWDSLMEAMLLIVQF